MVTLGTDLSLSFSSPSFFSKNSLTKSHVCWHSEKNLWSMTCKMLQLITFRKTLACVFWLFNIIKTCGHLRCPKFYYHFFLTPRDHFFFEIIEAWMLPVKNHQKMARNSNFDPMQHKYIACVTKKSPPTKGQSDPENSPNIQHTDGKFYVNCPISCDFSIFMSFYLGKS